MDYDIVNVNASQTLCTKLQGKGDEIYLKSRRDRTLCGHSNHCETGEIVENDHETKEGSETEQV